MKDEELDERSFHWDIIHAQLLSQFHRQASSRAGIMAVNGRTSAQDEF